MLGPLAVDPRFEGRGIGGTLARAAIEAARQAGEGLVILVGDAPYFSRFGFSPIPPGRLTLPGPVGLEQRGGVRLAGVPSSPVLR